MSPPPQKVKFIICKANVCVCVCVCVAKLLQHAES